MSTSASSSTIVVGTVNRCHLLKIDSYSRTRDLLPCGTCATSRDFRVGNYTAHIQYYPNIYYVSLKLILDVGTSVLHHKRGQVQFSVLDQAGKPVSEYTETTTIDFTLNQDSFTFFWRRSPCFTFSANLIKGEKWEKWVLLNGDCFTIRCDITLMEAPSATTPVEPDAVAPPSDLHRHLGGLLLGGEGADVKFQVGEESFHAHRCVLAARSSVFKAEFFGPMAMEEHTVKGVVHVDGVEAQVFKAFLHFVYTDTLPDISKEEEIWMAQHLLVVADRYDTERLKRVCEDKLLKSIDVNSATTTLALAEQHHYYGLKEACLDFLELPGNLKAVVASDGFDHLATSCPAVLREIIAKLAEL
ncbi:hypothetical protein QYE76_019715 [Lolium multiflorum]|uniref:BTB domain-containing protein n=1 Tax=Lolium multiflorum TaxID=4521 RepID=A0AAD8R3I9_LOLMU|nr:hypothetical protein QYE76_019715 [Lolium multiflorum]